MHCLQNLLCHHRIAHELYEQSKMLSYQSYSGSESIYSVCSLNRITNIQNVPKKPVVPPPTQHPGQVQMRINRSANTGERLSQTKSMVIPDPAALQNPVSTSALQRMMGPCTRCLWFLSLPFGLRCIGTSAHARGTGAYDQRVIGSIGFLCWFESKSKGYDVFKEPKMIFYVTELVKQINEK